MKILLTFGLVTKFLLVATVEGFISTIVSQVVIEILKYFS